MEIWLQQLGRTSSIYSCRGGHFHQQATERWYMNSRLLSFVCGLQPVHYEADQLRGYYHVHFKCTKNYKYILSFLFDVASTNAFILHSYFEVTTGTPMTLKQFRIKLAEQLIGSYKSRKRAGRLQKRPCSPSTSTTLTISLEKYTCILQGCSFMTKGDSVDLQRL